MLDMGLNDDDDVDAPTIDFNAHLLVQSQTAVDVVEASDSCDGIITGDMNGCVSIIVLMGKTTGEQGDQYATMVAIHASGGLIPWDTIADKIATSSGQDSVSRILIIGQKDDVLRVDLEAKYKEYRGDKSNTHIRQLLLCHDVKRMAVTNAFIYWNGEVYPASTVNTVTGISQITNGSEILYAEVLNKDAIGKMSL